MKHAHSHRPSRIYAGAKLALTEKISLVDPDCSMSWVQSVGTCLRQKASRKTQCPISSFRLSSSVLTFLAVLLANGRCCFKCVAIAVESWT